MSHDDVLDGLTDWQQTLLQRHQLQPQFLARAQYWFDPLADRLVHHQQGANRPVLIAVNGSQGSGKSTLCAYLELLICAKHGLRAVTLSLDDFYFSRSHRLARSSRIHPLLATRGVPGTHDMPLLMETLDALLDAGRELPVAVPRFDKATDSRFPEADQVRSAPDIVMLEGWCLGARPQAIEELVEPINSLEESEDPDGIWRNYVNAQLARDFVPLYQRVEQWIMLQAPSFDCVFQWRREQELKLAQARGAKRGGTVMDDAQLSRFIQHYERLTRACLTGLPQRVNHLYILDGTRQVSESRLDQLT